MDPQPGTAVPDTTPVEGGDVADPAPPKTEPADVVPPSSEPTESEAKKDNPASGDAVPPPVEEPMDADTPTPAVDKVDVLAPAESLGASDVPASKEEPVVQAMEAEEGRPVSATEEKAPDESSATVATETAIPAAPTPVAAKKPKVDTSTLPTRQYLDQTVVPILLQGLSWLAKTRPEDPIPALSNYLLEHKQEFEVPEQNNLNGTS